jgi:hypothetical protein
MTFTTHAALSPHDNNWLFIQASSDCFGTSQRKVSSSPAILIEQIEPAEKLQSAIGSSSHLAATGFNIENSS